MNVFISKLKEVLYSILPITIIVLIFNYTLTPLGSHNVNQFIAGTFLMILGIPLFLVGIDISITPIGEQISELLIKSNKLWLILFGGGIFGFIVTVSEPDLHILAGQVRAITNGEFNSNLMVFLVCTGVGIMVSFAIFRILKNIYLKYFMTIIYLIIFVLGCFTQPDFLAIAFDASGNTTGSVSVPFILAIAVGISAMTRSNEKEENDGFGMLGIASAGAIAAVMLQGIFNQADSINASLVAGIPDTKGLFQNLISQILQYVQEAFLVILPILAIYLVLNFIWIKTPVRQLKRLLIGVVYTYIGLILFLTGINIGFIEASRQMGTQIAALDKPWLLVLVGMLLGLITIPAEPSVHVLTHQIEDNTAGSIKSFTVMITLSCGVAVAVGLSMLRILIPSLQLWHILLPGMVLAILLSFIVPDIFVGIAYDSGGVAAGTMTSVFILPFAQGAAEHIPNASIVRDGFGIIALVAMTPLIAVQLLGFIYVLKSHLQKSSRKTETTDKEE